MTGKSETLQTNTENESTKSEGQTEVEFELVEIFRLVVGGEVGVMLVLDVVGTRFGWLKKSIPETSSSKPRPVTLWSDKNKTRRKLVELTTFGVT